MMRGRSSATVLLKMVGENVAAPAGGGTPAPSSVTRRLSSNVATCVLTRTTGAGATVRQRRCTVKNIAAHGPGKPAQEDIQLVMPGASAIIGRNRNQYQDQRRVTASVPRTVPLTSPMLRIRPYAPSPGRTSSVTRTLSTNVATCVWASTSAATAGQDRKESPCSATAPRTAATSQGTTAREEEIVTPAAS